MPQQALFQVKEHDLLDVLFVLGREVLSKKDTAKFENGTDEISVLAANVNHRLVQVLLETEDEQERLVHERQVETHDHNLKFIFG